MLDRTIPTPTATTAGVLRPDEFARHTTLTRIPVAPALRNWVENHWCVRWELPAGATFVNLTLPHPACSLTVELGHPRAGVGADRVVITGVITRRFDVLAAGRAWVFGVKFRPGGLAALAGIEARAITDRTLPAVEVLPAEVVEPLRGIRDELEPAAAAQLLEGSLQQLLGGAPDPAYAEVLDIVADMLADRGLVRVAQIVDRHGVSRRRLERLFARYVGVGPKWVLARYRMHDVLAELDRGYDGSMAELAAEHGWYDQAHFAREFVASVGAPPGRYRELSRARPVETTR